MSATTADPLVGTVLDGRYRVVRRLAHGGMSTVYVGHDDRLERPVAIKVMNVELARDPAFIRRFTREAQAAAKLWHPNVVAVHDQGSDADHEAVFLIMELVRGATLRDLLRERGRLEPGEALAVIEPLLTGLAAAHTEGLVHRDIKPENVLISDAGRVLVVDFGLARAVAESSHTTHSGTGAAVFGTIAYLSPEQVERGYADARSDIYAVGILLYELLTGRPPYVGDNAVSVAYRHVNDDVPAPSSMVPGIPPELDDLVTQATDRNPLHRPVDAAAMLAQVRLARRRLNLENVAVPVVAPIKAETDPGLATTALETAANGTAIVAKDGTAAVKDGATMPANLAAVAHSAPQQLAIAAEPPRRRRKRRWILPLIATIVVLALVGGGTFWWMQYGRWTKVPSFASANSQVDVTALASDGNVGVTFAQAQFNEQIAKGSVISVKPPTGSKVRRGANVTVVLSRGPERYSVDGNLVGKPKDQVVSSLTSQFNGKITITTTTAYDDVNPSGTISSFDPPPGTAMKPGSTLTIVVSQGPTPVAIQDVTGMPAADATSALTAQKFTVVTSPDTQFSDTVPSGSVISTDPVAGTPTQPGQTVTIIVSKGQDLVTVPNVVGMKVADAVSALQSAGFVVQKQVYTDIAGLVGKQDPGAGTQLKRGSTVTITII